MYLLRVCWHGWYILWLLPNAPPTYTTLGMQLSVEHTASPRGGQLPEDLGQEAALLLLDEVDRGMEWDESGGVGDSVPAL